MTETAVARQHFSVVVRRGDVARCPQCGMWVESIYPSIYRQIHCWCDNWLEITYVEYVINELEWL